jgi:hypothetical protein
MNTKWGQQKGVAFRLLLLHYFAASHLSDACSPATSPSLAFPGARHVTRLGLPAGFDALHVRFVARQRERLRSIADQESLDGLAVSSRHGRRLRRF